MIRSVGFLLIVSIIFVGAHSAKASDWSRLDAGEPHLPWHITADQMTYDQQTEQYIAVGNVVITKKDRKILADFARFDHKNMKAYAEGHVIMTTGNDMMTGSRVEIDLNKETGIFYNSQVFLSENHFYINGDRIDKTGKDTYKVQKAIITTCDGISPDWRITSRRLKVTIEGYGYASHVSFWAKKIPILYAPYAVFPIKRQRQSGLLAPQFGHSERKGEEYVQPFFWAINQSTDATFYLHHMGRRGEKLGAEYRYITNSNSRGTVMLDYLKDKEIDDGTEDSSELWGYPGDSYLRLNSDRYWFRMKHNQALPYGFSAYLDLDIVSDQDYLAEFKDRYTGFDHTEKIYNETFGRQIDAYTDTVRVNRLNASKSWSSYSLITEMRWYDDIIDRTQQKTRSTLQSLPAVEFNGSRQPLFQSPFFFDLDSGFTHFYRIEGQKWHEAEIYPRFYLPTTFGNYFAFEPSVGVRTTNWHFYSDSTGPYSQNRVMFRQMYDVKLDLSSDLYRIFDVGSQRDIKTEISPDADAPRIDKIKHALRPQVIYNFIPYIDHDQFPVSKQSTATYSLTNTFTSRTLIPPTTNVVLSPGASTPKPTYSYHQFAYLKLEQTYDLIEAYADKAERRPFSNMTVDFKFNPFSYLSFQADAQWSPYENWITSHNEKMTISDIRGDSISMEHRYSRLSSESFYATLFIKLTDRLSANVEYELDMYNDDVIRSNLGFSYSKQCWSIDVNYIREPLNNERRYEFMITLYGIGQFGAKVSGFGAGTSSEEE